MDTRPRVSLNGKTVVLAQLGAEVGAPLARTADEVVITDIQSTVTAVQLAAAVAAHTPQPTDNDRAADLRGKAAAALDANATYLALTFPTNAQVAAQVDRLTRECNALIRLTVGRLDSTTGT